MRSRPDALDFPDTGRFEIRRRLGAGSSGVVYEGWDRERQTPVALKWLSSIDAETIHRFKNEFRSLAEISHPNLVQLYDLACEDERWFFTMELVRGMVLPHHLRPGVLPAGPETLRRAAMMSGTVPRGTHPDTLDLARTSAVQVPADTLRAVFSQLARGVHALHEAGKLHRDLKCQNVIVTDEQRVVLLDFGLVREVDASHTEDLLDIAGTPLYMAPEQCRGAPIDRAADWYAFGVMLYRALADRFPYDGRMHAIMRDKQVHDAPSLEGLDVPRELAELATRLLARDPSQRPSGPEVLDILGARRGPRPAFPPRPAETFVGRRRELAMLQRAHAALREEGPTALYVHGASGIGKTALVHHFLDSLPEGTLVLEGRCFERERLPYKALDRVVDSLAFALRKLPDARCAELVPPHAADLVQVFPALGRVPSFRAAELTGPADPQERRRRAIEGFGELFRRLATDRDVVVFVDDLQWGDRDSAMLVAPLLEAAGARLLWIGTFRTDEAAGSPFLDYLGVRGGAGGTLIDLSELEDAEARALLEAGLDGAGRDPALLERIAREAAGSPLFIDLLVRRAQADGPVAGLDLAAAIDERIAALAPEARRLISALAVRARPLERALAADVLEVPALDVTTLTHLRNGRLIRMRGGEELEIYHDRIREAVAARMRPEDERTLHASLASALEQRGADPESLAYHHRGAGQLAEAFRFTLEAARRAEEALAFERAAELYRSALELGTQLPRVSVDAAGLRAAEADALRNAGRGAEAAEAYLIAAAASPRPKALELRRLAGEQYLLSGHLDEGRAVLRAVLGELGMSLPEHPARALGEFLLRRAQVRVRGLSFTESEGPIPPAELRRIDACWAMAVGLAMVDPVRGGVFQARHLLAALDAGDPRRVARAVAIEIPFSATPGMPNRRRTAELELRGRELAERANDPFTYGLLSESIGGAAWLEGRWYDALEHEERGIAIHRRSGGAAWELTTATIVLLDSLWRMGRWRELFERYPAVLADAVARGDLLLETYTRVKFRSLSYLAADQPDGAIRVARDAVGRWSQSAFTLLQLWELFVHVEALLYAGRAEQARERLEASWPALARSQLLRLQMYDVTMRDLAGRVALACASRATRRRRATLLGEVEATVRTLERLRAPWALGLASALSAGVAATRGERRRAMSRLERAEERLRASAMDVHAQVIRARRAELAGEPVDTGRLTELGLVRPDRWVALLAPGRWS